MPARCLRYAASTWFGPQLPGACRRKASIRPWGVTLAGAQIQAQAHWSPNAELIEVRNGVTHLIVPAGSAALLFLD